MFEDVPVGVWLLSWGYFFIFFGFDPAQNLVTRNFPEYGVISVVALYVSFAFATPFVPWVLQKVGPHFVMVIAPVGYTLCTIGTITNIAGLFILGGVCCGVSAAGLWVAGGRLIALESTEINRGQNNGCVFAASRLGSIFGNLTTGVIMDVGKLSMVFIVCCSAICLAHVPMYMYFKRPRVKPEEVECSSRCTTSELTIETPRN